jgi:hypothetical protein
MKLKLTRAELGKASTLGELFVNGQFECYVLEDKDRQLEIDPSAKVYGETCIPRGTYKIIITFSNRFKKELPLLVDVQGFEGIRIHPGNVHQDTHGCLLPGTSYVKVDGVHTVQNSRNAFFKLYQKIEAAIDAGEDVEIEVV